MNISKQAIEAGAAAAFECDSVYLWHGQYESTRELHRNKFAAGLTAALEHIIPEKCEPRDELWFAFMKGVDEHRGYHECLNYALAFLRGEGKQASVGDELVSALTQGVADLKNGVPLKATEYANGERKTGTFANGTFTPDNPDDVERVARAMFDDDVRYYNWKIVWEKIEARKEYLRCATAAIRAMRGQLWGVFSGNGLVLDKSTFARFVSHDRQLLEMVCRVFDEKYPSVKHEVRPYTAPREESAEEIAMSILTPPMFYSESFMKDAQARVAQAIREAEKRGAGKAVEHGA